MLLQGVRQWLFPLGHRYRRWLRATLASPVEAVEGYLARFLIIRVWAWKELGLVRCGYRGWIDPVRDRVGRWWLWDVVWINHALFEKQTLRGGGEQGARQTSSARRNRVGKLAQPRATASAGTTGVLDKAPHIIPGLPSHHDSPSSKPVSTRPMSSGGPPLGSCC